MAKKKKPATHKVIAKKLGLARSTVTITLNQVRDSRITEKTIRRVFKVAEKIGYDFTRIKRGRRRKFDRKPVNLKAEIEIYLRDGHLFDSGDTRIKNLSPNGALLKRLCLLKNVLPLNPFTIRLRIIEGRLKGVQTKGEMVRFESNGHIDIGVRFLEVDKISQERLAKFIE